MALPGDSYLQPYFRDVAQVLRVGPPLYFVVRNLNVSEGAPDVGRICSVAGCDPGSLVSRVADAARAPAASLLAAPAASWLDDFISWTSPEIPQCCRAFPNGTACPPPDQPPCAGDPAACADCRACFVPGDLPAGRPVGRQVVDALPRFLAARPSAGCAKGGAGAYTDAVQVGADLG